jgi:hypothetical protein
MVWINQEIFEGYYKGKISKLQEEHIVKREYLFACNFRGPIIIVAHFLLRAVVACASRKDITTMTGSPKTPRGGSVSSVRLLSKQHTCI